jgi:hypothetical protein
MVRKNGSHMSAAHSASISFKPMTIITLFQLNFNKLKIKVVYGPQSIPPWHHLYHKKCWRVGWYRRKLILFDKTVRQFSASASACFRQINLKFRHLE